LLNWSQSGLLLSGSYDRNAYVWSEKDNTFKPQLIQQDDNHKGIITGEWAHDNDKISLTNATKKAMVGWWNDDLKMWILKKLGNQFTSSLISSSFHPSGRVIGLGSSNQHFY